MRIDFYINAVLLFWMSQSTFCNMKKPVHLLKYGKLIPAFPTEFPTFQQSFHNNSRPFKNS
ncbi:hypothetical protein IW22_23765 [Chryseobacterium sp. JM1]|nr:hypothetical protein IW22_23765 [Chryseobacterium sp. JM1]